MKLKFSEHLLTEDKQFLADRVKDVLEAVEDLVRAGKQIGARPLVRNSEGIVNQIRQIIHQSWSRTEYKYLERLQICGCALMKTIDEKGDLRDTLNSVRQELLDLLDKLGEPINKGRKKSKPKEEPQQPPAQQEEPQQSQLPPGSEQQPPPSPQQPPQPM